MKLPIAAALLLLTTSSVGAAELLGKERLELTPFYGYRIGGHVSSTLTGQTFDMDGAQAYGGLMDLNLQSSNFKLEFLWSHQKTQMTVPVISGLSLLRLNVDHFQAGIMQEVGEPRARFSVSLLLGGSRLESPGLGSETKFSGSLAGSGKVFLSPHVGIRLDARAFAVFVQGSAAGFCGGGCVLVYNGTAMWQEEFTGGLIIAF